MAFPTIGFHTLSDDISRKMWGMSKLEATSGDGAISLASQPVSGEVRDQCLKFESATCGASDSATVPMDLDYNLLEVTVASVDHQHAIPRGWFRLRFHWAAPTGAGSEGDTAILNFVSGGTTTTLRVGLAASSATQFVLEFSQPSSTTALGTSRALNFGDWHEVLVYWEVNGHFEAWTKTGSETDWTAETVTEPSAFAVVDSMSIGVDFDSWSGASNAALYVDDFALSYRQRSDVEPHRYLSGSGIRDTSDTKASPVLIYPDNLFASATHARVTYSANADFSGSSSSAWVALSGVANHALGLPLTGLTSATNYYSRFEIATSANEADIVFTSETYRFATLPAAGDDTPVRFGFGSCNNQESGAHPYISFEPFERFCQASPDRLYIGYYHYGDQGYEGLQQDGDYGASIAEPTETQAEYEQIQREFTADVDMHKLMVAGAFICQPDDHQFINDGDARMAPGGALENTLANDWSSNQVGSTYGVTTTLGELWVNGLTVFDDWWRHWTDEATGRYQVKKFGSVYFILLDTRTERIIVTGDTYTGATQIAWLKARMDEFANDSNAQTCVLMTQSGWAQEFCKPSEGWGGIDLAEYEDVVDYIYDSAGGTGVPASKNVLILSGDDHSVYVWHDRIQTTAHPTIAGPIKGELKLSGGSIGFANFGETTYAANILAAAPDQAAATQCKSSGGMIDISADGTGAEAVIWRQDKAVDTADRVTYPVRETIALFGDATLSTPIL